jgi:hypothetical protein
MVQSETERVNLSCCEMFVPLWYKKSSHEKFSTPAFTKLQPNRCPCSIIRYIGQL